MVCGAGDAALFATFLRRPDRQSGSKTPIGRMLGDLAYLFQLRLRSFLFPLSTPRSSRDCKPSPTI